MKWIAVYKEKMVTLDQAQNNKQIPQIFKTNCPKNKHKQKTKLSPSSLTKNRDHWGVQDFCIVLYVRYKCLVYKHQIY